MSLLSSLSDNPRSGLIHIFRIIAILKTIQAVTVFPANALASVARLVLFIPNCLVAGFTSCGLFLWHGPMIAQLKGQTRGASISKLYHYLRLRPHPLEIGES